MFNTLLYTKKLEGVGVTRKIAEAHVEILSEVVETKLATKDDLSQLGKDLRHEMREMESRIVIRLGGLMFLMTAFSITTTVALIKLL